MASQRNGGYHTVDDLRYRLQVSEQTLQNLDALHHGGQHQQIQYRPYHGDNRGVLRQNGRKMPGSPESGRMPPLTLDDLSPEESSDRGNISHRQDDNVVVKLQFNDSSSWDNSSRGQLPSSGKGNDSQKHVITGQDVSSRSGISSLSGYEEENASLRGRLQQVREENTKMVSQNHSLLNQLEAGTHQLRQAQNEIHQLNAELKMSDEKQTKMESAFSALRAEKDKQVKHVNDLGEEVERYRLELSSSQRRNESLEGKVQELVKQVDRLEQVKDRANQDRDIALKTAEQIQQSYEKYQAKVQDKINKTASNESHLMEQLEHLSTEREALIRDCKTFRENLEVLNHEKQRLCEENLMEKERRTEVENNVMELRMQLAKYTHNLVSFEGQSQNVERLKHDNSQLKQQISDLKSQLEDSKTEMDYTRTQMKQLETMAREKQTGESGVMKSRELSDSLDSGISNNANKTYTDIITQLSQQLAAKEAEIQALKNTNFTTSTPTSSPSKLAATSRMEQELKSVLERKTHTETRVFELESVVSSLEEERETLSQQVVTLQRRLGEGGEERGSLQSKLDHRAQQVEELQAELGDKVRECTVTSRELRKLKSQLATVERQLDDKVYEVTQHVSQLSDLESQLQQTSTALDSCRRQLQQEQTSAASAKTAADTIKQLHAQQCLELQQQIDVLQSKWQDITLQHEQAEKRLSVSQQATKSKDAEITGLRQEIERRSLQSENTLSELQRQSSTAAEQMRQLEASLVVTKQELQIHMDQLRETKCDYEVQLQQKDAKLDSLDSQLRQCLQALEEKTSAYVKLETVASDRLRQLEEGQGRIVGLEQACHHTDKQVQTLQQQLDEERSQNREEQRRTEDKLRQVCQQLELSQVGEREVNRKLVELTEEKGRLGRTVDELENEIEEGREMLNSAQENCEKLEADLRLTKDQLQEQCQKVDNLESELGSKEEKLAQTEESAARCQTQLAHSQAELHKTLSRTDELEKGLTATQDAFTQRQEELDRLTQLLREKDEELHNVREELDEQGGILKQRQWELQQRAAQITQLDMLMKEHGNQTEQRLIRLESALKKSQVEAAQRAQQVSTLDEQLHTLKGDLREKELLLQQAVQRETRLKTDTQQRLQTQEQEASEMGEQVEQLKAENLQLKQELIFSRDEHKKLSHSVVECRKELSLVTRDRERLKSQLQDLNTNIDSKEEDYESLKEELSLSKVKEVQLKSQAEADSRKLQRQMDLLKEQHALEISELQQTQQLIVHSQQELGASFKSELEKSHMLEEKLRHELQATQSEVTTLRSEVKAGKAMLDQANESLVIKDAEMARLQARNSGLQRSLIQLSGQSSHLEGVSQLSATSTSFAVPSQSTSIYTHSYSHPLPDMDLSAISDATSGKEQSINGPHGGDSMASDAQIPVGSNVPQIQTTIPQQRIPVNIPETYGPLHPGQKVVVEDSLQGMLQEVNRAIMKDEHTQPLLQSSEALQAYEKLTQSTMHQVKGPHMQGMPLENVPIPPLPQDTTMEKSTATSSKRQVDTSLSKSKSEKPQAAGKQTMDRSHLSDRSRLDKSQGDKSVRFKTKLPTTTAAKGKQARPCQDQSKKKSAPSTSGGKVTKTKAMKESSTIGSDVQKLSQTIAQSTDIKDRLRALMGKVSNMTVEQFEPDESHDNINNSAAESECPMPEMNLMPKQYSPVLLDKSVTVCSAIEHYETGSNGSGLQVEPQVLDFSTGSSATQRSTDSGGTENGQG